MTFADVGKILQPLEGITDATAYGTPCFKLNGRIFACLAINKQAEPNSLMVRMPIDQRDTMIDEEPDVYYLKPHYAPYPCLLVRLSKVRRDALRDLLRGAWRLARAEKPVRARTRSTAKARPKTRRAVSQ